MMFSPRIGWSPKLTACVGEGNRNAAMPLGCALKRMSHTQKCRFVEWLADELKRDRQAVARKSGGNGQSGQAEIVDAAREAGHGCNRSHDVGRRADGGG